MRILYNTMATTAKQLEYNKKWKKKNPHKVKSQLRRWREKHPDKMKAIRERYLRKKYGGVKNARD